jgi:hypothetical protein
MLLGILGEAGSGKDEAMRYLVNRHGFYSLALADAIKVYCSWMFGWTADILYGSSKKRNEPDERYAFMRCPKCGFTHPSLALAPGFDVIHCPVCHANGVTGEWRTQLSSRYALQSLGDWARNLFGEAYVNFTLERADIVQRRRVLYDPLWVPLRDLGLNTKERWSSTLEDPVRHVVISDVRLPNEIEGIQRKAGKVYRIQRENHEDTTSTGIPNHNSEVAQRSIPDEALDGVIDNNGTFDELYCKLENVIGRN